MYGTSRLIIPPKPARNSPYIPKLRIKLRPSTGRNRLNRENDRSDSLTTRTPRFSGRSTTGYMNGCSSDSPNVSQTESNVTNIAKNTNVLEKDSTLGKRTTRKRKSVPSAENVDLDDPESILTTISLKALINQDIFYSLPVDTQRMLATLLPLYDHEVQSWLGCFESPYTAASNSCEDHYAVNKATGIDKEQPDLADASSSVDSSSSDVNGTASKAVWLHPSSLNNEFFTKALQDYASSQARGDFAASRVRHRAGLRPSVRGQSRYTSPSLRSSQDQSHAVLEESSDDQGSTRVQSSKRFRQGTPGFRSKTPKSSSAKDNRVPSKDSLSTSSTSTGTGQLARLHRRLNTNRVCRPLRRAKQLTTTVAVSPASESLPATECSTVASLSSTTPRIQPAISSPPATAAASHRYSAEDLPGAVPTSSSLSATLLSTNDWQKVSQCVSPPPPSESGCAAKQQVIRQRRLSDPLCIGAGVDHAKNCSLASSAATTTSTTSSPTVRASLLLSSSRAVSTSQSSQQQPGIGLANETCSDVTPPQMPPPRQTKTLASMREKLRAKRLLKETERGQTPNGRQHFFHALPCSMTPHPACGGNGYFNAPAGYLPLTTSPLKSSSSGIFASPTHGSCASLSLLLNGASDDVSCGGRLSRSSVYSGDGSSGQSSPRSLPALGTSACPVSNGVVQPPVPTPITGQLGSSLDGFDSHTFLPSYPASPHSTTGAYSGQAVGVASTATPGTGGRFSSPVSSPQPISGLHPASAATGCYGLPLRQEHQQHSVSAPPTPLSPQAGHPLLGSAVVGGDRPCVVGQSSSSTSLTPVSQSSSAVSLRLLPMLGSSLALTPSDASQTTPVTSVSGYYSPFCSNSGDSTAGPSTGVLLGTNPLPLRMSQSNPQLSTTSPSSTSSSNCPSLISPTVNSVPIQKIDKIHSLADLSPSADSSPTTSVRSEVMSKLLTNVVTATTTPTVAGSSPSNSNGNSNNSSIAGVTPAKPNATTRAYFVDGENLPEAVAIIQNLNPGATITQQQFLLIPSPNKSQLFLCRAPVTNVSESSTVPSVNRVLSVTAKTAAPLEAAPKGFTVPACSRSPLLLQPTPASTASETVPVDSNSLTNSKTATQPTVLVDRGSKPPAGAQIRASQGVKRTANQTHVSSSSSKPTTTLSIQPNHSAVSSQFSRLKPSTKSADQQPAITSGSSNVATLLTTATTVKQQIRQSQLPHVPLSGYLPTAGNNKPILMSETVTSCHPLVGAGQPSAITVSLLAATPNVATSSLQNVNSSVDFSQSDLCIGKRQNTAYSSPCPQATGGALLTGSLASDFLIPSQNQVNTVISSPALLYSVNPPMTSCQYPTLAYDQSPQPVSEVLAACQAVTSTSTPPAVTNYLLDGSQSNNLGQLDHRAAAPFQILRPSANSTTVLFNGGSPTTGMHLATTSTTTTAVAISSSLYSPINNSISTGSVIMAPHSLQSAQTMLANNISTGSVIMAPHSLQSAQTMLANNSAGTVCYSPRLVVTPASLPSNYLHHHQQQQQ